MLLTCKAESLAENEVDSNNPFLGAALQGESYLAETGLYFVAFHSPRSFPGLPEDDAGPAEHLFDPEKAVYREVLHNDHPAVSACLDIAGHSLLVVQN